MLNMQNIATGKIGNMHVALPNMHVALPNMHVVAFLRNNSKR